MDDPVRVISTVQVGITADGILLGALGEPVVRELLGEDLPEWISFVLGFAVVTYLSVVLGELVPKALTLDRAEALAALVALVARPIELLSVGLRPVVWLLERSASLLLRPFGIEEVIAGDAIRTSAELRALIDEAEGSGVIPRAPGRAAAQRLRLRRPRGARHHGAGPRRRLARRGARRGRRPGASAGSAPRALSGRRR